MEISEDDQEAEQTLRRQQEEVRDDKLEILTTRVVFQWVRPAISLLRLSSSSML